MMASLRVTDSPTKYENVSFDSTPTEEEDNNSDLIMDFIELIINCYLTHIISAIGSACNVITVIVLEKTGKADSNTIVLLSLAICDLMFLLTLMVRKVDCIVARFDPVSGVNYLAYMTVYVQIPSRIALVLSSAHIIIIAVERFIAVNFPFKAKFLISRPRISFAVFVQYVAMLAMCCPYLAYCTLHWTHDERFNTTVASARYSQYYLDNFDGLQYFNTIVLGILRGPVSSCIVICCCSAVVYRLREVSRQRVSMATSGHNVDVKVSRMLLAICVVFVITNVITFAVSLYSFQADGTDLLSRTFYFLLNIEELFFALNSSANFFIYIWMSTKFNKTCRSLFCRDSNKTSQNSSKNLQ